uniref:THUMP domain-containing protein n=1 Tax=Thermofilum pendens TaxID=2269 RepID=A0A7C1NZS6_THEPE
MLRVLATTVPGLEFVVAEEAAEICRQVKASYTKLSGRVFLEVDDGCLPHLAARARSLEGLRLIAGEAISLNELLAGVVSFVRELGVEGLYFSVHAERVTKEGGFTSLDLARIVGEKVREELGLKVSLDFPDLPLYVEYEGGRYRYGLDLSFFHGLRDRPYRVFVHPSALNPVIAYAMCRLAMPFETLLDPFCGSGTIPLECSQVTEVQAFCSDVNEHYTAGARLNLLKAGTYSRIHILASDVRRHPFSREVDAIVTNPPFGIRERAVGGLEAAYRGLFDLASSVLREEGKLVVLTTRLKASERLGARRGLSLVAKHEVNEGGLTSYIAVFSKSLSS